jgi:dihydroflavonol-4-reductase
MCVSNPYGPLDWQPSQGQMIKAAALGKMPVYVKGVSTEVVGIEDVADAFLLAGERGRVGERYIISESFMPMRDMLQAAAGAVGAKPPRLGVPLALLYAVGWTIGGASRMLRRDLPLNTTGVRLLHIMSPADNGKARRELGWQPRPTAESIRRAARFYVEHA